MEVLLKEQMYFDYRYMRIQSTPLLQILRNITYQQQ